MAQQRARGRNRGLDWALLAEKMLKYLLHAAALEHLDGARAADPRRPVGMARVVQWAASERLNSVADILRTSPQASHWSELVEDMARSAPETFYSIKINLHEALNCWEDPGILRPGGRGCARLRPARAGNGGLTQAAVRSLSRWRADPRRGRSRWSSRRRRARPRRVREAPRRSAAGEWPTSREE